MARKRRRLSRSRSHISIRYYLGSQFKYINLLANPITYTSFPKYLQDHHNLIRSTASTDFHLFDPLQGDSKLFINSELILITSSSHHSLMQGFHLSHRSFWSWQENVQIVKRYLIYPPLIDVRSSFRVQCVLEATNGNKRLHMEKSTFHLAVIYLTTTKITIFVNLRLSLVSN